MVGGYVKYLNGIRGTIKENWEDNERWMDKIKICMEYTE